MNSWLYLFVASCFEVCWTYSLKALNVQNIKDLKWSQIFTNPTELYALLPLLGYIGFGLGNVTFFSLALRSIPASTAYGAWMAMALVGLKIADVLWFKQGFSVLHLFYMTLVLVGILGLRRPV